MKRGGCKLHTDSHKQLFIINAIMKSLNLLSPILAMLILLSLDTYAQDLPTSNSNLWVTIENESAVPQMKEGKLVSSDEEVQKLITEFSIISVEQAFPASRQESLEKVYEISCFCNEDALTEAMISSRAFISPEKAPQFELMALPNDYSLTIANDYALNLINAEQAWSYSTGDAGTVLGVSDGSFYTNHEELQNKYTSVTNNSYAPAHYYQHGTAVAVAVAGSTDNSDGKSAIGYNSSLVLNTIGYNQLLQLTYEGARVINVSWSSGCSYNQYCQDIINEVNNFGTIIVAAAGNGGTCGGPTALVYPAAYDNVIAVSSVGPNDNHERIPGVAASTHQHNSSVDICAPGYDVALTVSPGWYLTGNGTSFAAPYVTGTIGLMLSANPCLSYDDVLFILQETAVNIDALNPNYAGSLGAGRLDAGAALAMASDYSCAGNGPGNSNGNGSSGSSGQGSGNNGNGIGNTGTTGSGAGDIGVHDRGNRPSFTDSNTSAVTEGRYAQEGTGEGSSMVKEEAVIQGSFEATIYPNPSSGRTTIMWEAYAEGMTIMVYDSESNLIMSKEINSSEISAQVEASVSGMYFVRLVQEGQQVWMGKFIKL